MKNLEERIAEICAEDRAEFIDDPAEIEKLREQVRRNAVSDAPASRPVFGRGRKWAAGMLLACAALVICILPFSSAFVPKEEEVFFGTGNLTTQACTEQQFWELLPEDSALPEDYLNTLSPRYCARLYAGDTLVGLSMTRSRINELASAILGIDVPENIEITVFWENVRYMEEILLDADERTEYGHVIRYKDFLSVSNYYESRRSFRDGDLTYYISAGMFVLPGDPLPTGTLFADEVIAAMFG